MFNVGAGEALVILLLALLVLGPERLPKAAGQVGRAVSQLRQMASGFQDEIRRAMDDVGDVPFRPGEERIVPPGHDEVKAVNPPAQAALPESSTSSAPDDGTEATEEPVETHDGTEATEEPVDPHDGTETAEQPGEEASGQVTPLRPRVEGDDGDARATG